MFQENISPPIKREKRFILASWLNRYNKNHRNNILITTGKQAKSHKINKSTPNNIIRKVSNYGKLFCLNFTSQVSVKNKLAIIL